VTRYLSLAEFWYLAEYVTGITAATLIKASRVELADSALHAPRAGIGVDEAWLAAWLRDRVTFPGLNQEATR
jgi:hypothetical protein